MPAPPLASLLRDLRVRSIGVASEADLAAFWRRLAAVRALAAHEEAPVASARLYALMRQGATATDPARFARTAEAALRQLLCDPEPPPSSAADRS